MATKKKTATKSAEPSKIKSTRSYDLNAMEQRLTALDKAKVRSYDPYEMENRIYKLEQNSGGGSATIESLSITPSTSAQTFNSDDVDGYKPVTVSAVTSSIDANITAGNIKKDVTILGVTGTYKGNSGDLYIRDDATNKMTYVINDENITYYFNGFTKEAGDANFPSDFNYLIPEGLEKSKAYGSDKTTQIGWIGWYNNKIRTWSIDTSTTISGTFWGVVNVGGGESQNNPYTEPPTRG